MEGLRGGEEKGGEGEVGRMGGEKEEGEGGEMREGGEEKEREGEGGKGKSGGGGGGEEGVKVFEEPTGALAGGGDAAATDRTPAVGTLGELGCVCVMCCR